MTTTLDTLNGTEIIVGDSHLRAGYEGPAGTLYAGDADIIADYLANPEGECDIHGVMHHINLTHREGIFILTIDFVGHVAMAVFDGVTARELIFALYGRGIEKRNPHRP